MASRKDLLKAHGFTTSRLVSALVTRNPDDQAPPLRRVGTATFVSILIGVVLLAGSALFGLIRKQVTVDQWQKAGVVIHDSDSGQLFIWDEPTKALVPMNDVTSARLAAASGGAPEQVTVKSKDLVGISQRPRRGIPGAPYQLPLEANIDPFPLRVCATEPNPTGERFLTAQIGSQAPQPTSSVDVAVETPDGQQYVIMNGTSHKLVTQGGVSPLIENLPLFRVSAAWLASLPFGQPIERHEIPGAGGRPAKGTWTIGTLTRIGAENDANTRYYVQLNDGLVRISYLDMRLLVVSGTPEATPISESDYSQYADNTASFGTQGLPFGRPNGPSNIGNVDSLSLCATYPGGDQTWPSIAIGAPTPTRPSTMIHPVGNRADLIVMDSLSGAILQNSTLKAGAGNQFETATFLVTNGKIYGIPDKESRLALGYGDKTPIGRVPEGVLNLFPSGLPAGVSLSKGSIAAT
ncbi:type VII secretion protein EccB [Propionibacteriaceae bacterium G1746]|uniref:type VII secretion protein EccB n=1 Tax=Aestuariimicrobium sp. G57 TaxID=3418485 RepID=UPI003C1A45D0